MAMLEVAWVQIFLWIKYGHWTSKQWYGKSTQEENLLEANEQDNSQKKAGYQQLDY
jgi:hypothetical protein